MAETEVSKMVAVEERCGLDMSSYQDLPRSDCNGNNHHNQANDLDNSYVFVTGADDVTDGVVGDKDAVVGGSTFPPKTDDSQNGKIGAVSENGSVGQSNGDLYLGNHKDESSDEVEEGVQISESDSPAVDACKIENSPVPEVKQVEDSNGKIESLAEGEGFQVSIADSVEVHNAITEIAVEDATQVEDSNVITESVCEAVMEKAVDQNGEIEGQQENLDENQESQVRALGVVAEIGDNNKESVGEDQGNTSVTLQRSEDVAMDVDEHDLQSVGLVEAEEKSPTELAEAAEHEVSSSTSLRLDSESFPLEEEGRADLSSGILENQKGDNGANNIVQDVVEETDESKAILASTDSHDSILHEKNEGSSVSEFENAAQYHGESQLVNGSDSHVQTTSDFVLEEKDEDSSVSEVDQGIQCHEVSEEQPVVTGSDSHVLTTSDLALEEKDEDSSVSLIENGVQHHEESAEEPVVSGRDSHVQTTRELVLEEKNEDSSAYEVENGVEHHEESIEQPMVSSSDSHVETTCDLVLEGKIEDSSAREVENGAQHHEEIMEQPAVSGIDSHVETTCDMVLEEKDGDSSVSEIENGGEHHEESMDQQAVSDNNSHAQTTCDLVLEEKDDDSSLSDVENVAEHHEESEEQPDSCGTSHDTTPSQTVNEASIQPQKETEVSDVEEIEGVSSPPVAGPESQGSDCALAKLVSEKEIAFEDGDKADPETEISSGKPKDGDSSPEILDVKMEPDSHVREKTDDAAASCRTEISDSINLNSDGAANTELEIDVVEDVGDQLDSKTNLVVQENENEEASAASAGVSTTTTTDGEDKSVKAKTKPFNFLIRTPRFDDESLREKIRLAKLQVDEKTKLREAIQLQIQEKRANSQIHGIDYEFSKGEGRSARKLVRSKRMEIDSLQSMINKAKNALSIDDIDSQIHNMEHMIQHETLPLKEEKQLIREIKQLKQLREQLSSNMGSQDEIKQALEQREEIEERLKILRKELDILKNKVLKAEATAAEAEKKYDDENLKVRDLQAQFRAADEVRQAAYFQWQNLRKELTKKSKYFFKYKDDAAVATNYAFSRDTEALYRLCTDQVGSFMELWNTNPEFRTDYAKFNERSNIRRFGTLDCRSLGPDEQPPALPSYANERFNKVTSTPAEVNQKTPSDLAPSIPSVELNQKTPSENGNSGSKSIKKVVEAKSEKLLKQPAVSVQVNGFAANTVSDIPDEVHEEPIKSKEEIESLRKAEELRRAEAEANLKEQRRLEALAKANEARERKKRQAEKLQQRAELKTQKEAEQREKEREKRLRKKERKKAGITDANDMNSNCETAPSSESAAENGKEIDIKESSAPAAAAAAAKKTKKPWLAAKQSKSKSIPPPIRNRNKKKLQQWMWVGIASLIILFLFWLGNIGVFSNVALKRRGPVY